MRADSRLSGCVRVLSRVCITEMSYVPMIRRLSVAARPIYRPNAEIIAAMGARVPALACSLPQRKLLTNFTPTR